MNVRTDIAMHRGATLATGALRLLWNFVRLPVHAVLVLCEPLVRFLCSAVVVLGVFTAALFEISAVGPRFPFLGMLACSLGFGAVLLLYEGLIFWLMK